MKELSLHILDIAQNSLKAGAKNIALCIEETDAALTVTVTDDGCGMSAELLSRVTDPFATTRTTRRVGLGVPLLKMAAELTGGSLDIKSAPGEGTTISARFGQGHIDLPPLGDLPETIVTLVQGAPEVDFKYLHSKNGRVSELDTLEMRQALEGVPLDEPGVLIWIRDSLRESEDLL